MAGDVIDQFMWPYQRHFRIGVEHAAEAMLRSLGCPAEIEVYVIGFVLADARHPICVEPEDGPFRPDHFAGTEARAETLYAENPESGIRYSARHLHDRIHDGLRDASRGTAIAEALREHHPTGGTTFVVSRSAVVGQYAVYIAVGLPDELVSRTRSLKTTIKDRTPIATSLLSASVTELLRAATQALNLPDAGSNLRAIERTASELIRSGARNLVQSAMVLAGNEIGDSPFEPLTEISTLPYEKRTGFGRLIMAQPNASGIAVKLSLTQSVPLAQHRSIRKLLELSGRDGLSIMTDGVYVYGLGAFSGEDSVPETTFEVRIQGLGAWELLSDGQALMSVRHGSASLPRPRIDQGRFEDLAQRVLGTTGRCDPQRLWELAQAAANAEHGTMLVVTPAARGEAERLRAQATLIEPTGVTPDLLARLTTIDGAVLLEPDGTCVAIGVILDGTASEAGDPSRGARFNSALRYVGSTKHPTLIILVSEDGMINLLPDLRKRVSRKTIEANLKELRMIAAKDPFDPERFYRIYRRLEELAFYLSADKCSEVNQLRAAMEERRWHEHQMRVTSGNLKANPGMDDSYFLE